LTLVEDENAIIAYNGANPVSDHGKLLRGAGISFVGHEVKNAKV
jgi:hypothetical protein